MKMRGLFTYIVFMLSLILSNNSAALSCQESFESVLEQHLNAIQNRDLKSYMDTISMVDGMLMVLPDGSMWTSRTAIEAGHREWFADDTWKFNTQLMRKDVTDGYGLAVYQVTVDRPEKSGKPFLLAMLFAPDGQGCWRLVHDQNTLLPTTEK